MPKNKVLFQVRVKQELYEMPNCRFKVDEYGNVRVLVKKDGKWMFVSGKLEFLQRAPKSSVAA